MMISKRSILLVEDDKVDALTVERAMKDLNITNKLYNVGNGEEALEFLHDKNIENPGIILLDINMPKMNGIEFLEIIKKDEELRRIPVIILTTSKDDQDRLNSFNLSVAGYMVKPVDYLQFVEIVRTIKLYWTLSELPD
ncbi:MAG: response regulator [Bacteroidetes bacterium]|nr:response regulator [Bacteroidota bacterium]